MSRETIWLLLSGLDSLFHQQQLFVKFLTLVQQLTVALSADPETPESLFVFTPANRAGFGQGGALGKI